MIKIYNLSEISKRAGISRSSLVRLIEGKSSPLITDKAKRNQLMNDVTLQYLEIMNTLKEKNDESNNND